MNICTDQSLPTENKQVNKRDKLGCFVLMFMSGMTEDILLVSTVIENKEMNDANQRCGLDNVDDEKGETIVMVAVIMMILIAITKTF